MNRTVGSTAEAVSLDPAQLRRAFSAFATGVTVVTGVRDDGVPVGVTANSFTSVSLAPPLLLWCLSAGSASASAFTREAPFAVHVLERSQRDVALHFARRVPEKFETDPEWHRERAPPALADVLVRFDCRVESLHAAGDHVIIVGRVQRVCQRPGTPLVFHEGRFGAFRREAPAAGVCFDALSATDWF